MALVFCPKCGNVMYVKERVRNNGHAVYVCRACGYEEVFKMEKIALIEKVEQKSFLQMLEEMKKSRKV